MKFHPYIAGWGMAGKGMAKALEIIKIINPDLQIAEPVLDRLHLCGVVTGLELGEDHISDHRGTLTGACNRHD